MNENKRKEMIQYFETRIADCKTQEQLLTADDRADEAVFAKIRTNVWDVFRTVFSAAVKSCGSDDEKTEQFFLAKTQQIPQNWRASLQKAEEHGDTEKAHLERIKLDTADEVTTAFQKIWRENHD